MFYLFVFFVLFSLKYVVWLKILKRVFWKYILLEGMVFCSLVFVIVVEIRVLDVDSRVRGFGVVCSCVLGGLDGIREGKYLRGSWEGVKIFFICFLILVRVGFVLGFLYLIMWV